MNKFIAFAFFALCATVAQAQVIPGVAGIGAGLPWLGSDLISQQVGGGSSSSAAAAAAASSSSAANQGVITNRLAAINQVPLVSGLGPLGLGGLNPWNVGGYGWPYSGISPLAPGYLSIM